MLVAENAFKAANSVAYIRVSSQRQVDEGDAYGYINAE